MIFLKADLDGERLVEDVKRNVEQTVAFDTVLRVRTSTGVRPVDFYGHFFMSNATDVETAGFDSDQAITVEIKHDDKLTDEDGVYIQVLIVDWLLVKLIVSICLNFSGGRAVYIARRTATPAHSQPLAECLHSNGRSVPNVRLGYGDEFVAEAVRFQGDGRVAEADQVSQLFK